MWMAIPKLTPTNSQYWRYSPRGIGVMSKAASMLVHRTGSINELVLEQKVSEGEETAVGGQVSQCTGEARDNAVGLVPQWHEHVVAIRTQAVVEARVVVVFAGEVSLERSRSRDLTRRIEREAAGQW